MMFGFNAPTDKQASAIIKLNGHTYQAHIVGTRPNDLMINIELHANDASNDDMYLLYSSMAVLWDDWKKLLEPGGVKLDELAFDERVLHDTGYCRNGGIVMY